MKVEFTSEELVEIFLAVGDKLRLIEERIATIGTNPVFDEIRGFWSGRAAILRRIWDKAMHT